MKKSQRKEETLIELGNNKKIKNFIECIQKWYEKITPQLRPLDKHLQ